MVILTRWMNGRSETVEVLRRGLDEYRGMSDDEEKETQAGKQHEDEQELTRRRRTRRSRWGKAEERKLTKS